MAIPELAEALAASTSVAGAAIPPTKAALEHFWRTDTKRNAMREVHHVLLGRRPPPGTSKSMDDIYRSLQFQLVNPAFLQATEHLLEGHGDAQQIIRSHLEQQLTIPHGGDRHEIVELIVDTLIRHVGRAQRDEKAAIDVATSIQADRVIAEMKQHGFVGKGWREETADGICVGQVADRLVAAITQDDGTVVIRDALSAERLDVFPAVAYDAGTAIAVNFVARTPMLITVDKDGTLSCHRIGAPTIDDATLPNFRFGLEGLPQLLDVQRSSSRALIMVTSTRGELQIRHWPSGRRVVTNGALPVTGPRALGVTWRRSQPLVILSDPDGVLRMYDVKTGQQCGDPWPMKGSRIYALATSTYMRRPVLFTGDQVGVVRMFDMNSRTQVGPLFSGQTGSICSIFVTQERSRKVVTSASQDGRVVVWDMERRVLN